MSVFLAYAKAHYARDTYLPLPAIPEGVFIRGGILVGVIMQVRRPRVVGYSRTSFLGGIHVPKWGQSCGARSSCAFFVVVVSFPPGGTRVDRHWQTDVKRVGTNYIIVRSCAFGICLLYLVGTNTSAVCYSIDIPTIYGTHLGAYFCSPQYG